MRAVFFHKARRIVGLSDCQNVSAELWERAMHSPLGAARLLNAGGVARDFYFSTRFAAEGRLSRAQSAVPYTPAGTHESFSRPHFARANSGARSPVFGFAFRRFIFCRLVFLRRKRISQYRGARYFASPHALQTSLVRLPLKTPRRATDGRESAIAPEFPARNIRAPRLWNRAPTT